MIQHYTYTTRNVQNALNKDNHCLGEGQKAIQLEHGDVLREGRIEKKRENPKMIEKGSNMTGWVKCPTSKGSYNLGIQDTITRFSQYWRQQCHRQTRRGEVLHIPASLRDITGLVPDHNKGVIIFLLMEGFAFNL